MTSKILQKLRSPLQYSLHLLWWSGLVASVIVSLSNRWMGIGVYNVPCGEERCTDWFQLTLAQMHQLAAAGLSPELFGNMTVILLAVQNLSSWMVGFLLYRYGYKDPYCIVASLLLILTGTMFSTDEMLFADKPWLFLLFQIVNGAGFLYPTFMFLLPGGRFVPRWTAVPALVWAVVLISDYLFPTNEYINFMLWETYLKGTYTIGLHVLIFFTQIYRYRHGASAEQKRQIRWFFGGMGLFLLSGIVDVINVYVQHGVLKFAGQILLYSGLMFIPLSVGIMVLESRLRPLSVAFNRSLVFLVFSITGVTAYALLLGVVGLLLHEKGNSLVALFATGIVAVLLHPLRVWTQKEVNLLVYGEREDPYHVLSEMSARLEGALTHRSLLPKIAEIVAQAIKVPYVAIEIHLSEGGLRTLASYGVRPNACTALPLSVQGEPVGRLLLGTGDSLENILPRANARIIEDLVRNVSIAVQAVQLTSELQRSRERLVTTREEERRRLRRDLHDGLGSGLASMNLRLDEALHQLDHNASQVRATLELVQSQVDESIADIRRLVYALRPPTLDDFGLDFAIEELVKQFKDPNLLITVEGFEDQRLQAASEVAVYRIVQEALTNVVRHAHASRCHIQLDVGEDELRLFIQDDGTGVPQERKSGVGIRSMKERAEELGGSCTIRSEAERGTTIEVRLPAAERNWTYA